MSDVNILVLGGTKSGKTCFMLAMYDDMRIGYGGFTFSAVDVDVDRSLVERFRIMVDGQGQERWPVGTTATDDFDFNLNYALRRFMVFKWTDYRGGMLTEAGDVNRTLRDLVASSHMALICCPGEWLFDARRRDRRARAKLSVAETQQAMEPLGEGKERSLCVIVTMSDCYAKRYRSDHPGATAEEIEAVLIDDVREVYQNFFVDDGGWRVMVCPVTLGQDLADNEAAGEISPINMHLPVMFAYHEYARALARQWRDRIDATEDMVSALQKGFFSRLFNRGRIQEAASDIDKLEEYFEDVQSRLGKVAKLLAGEHFFFNGEPASLE